MHSRDVAVFYGVLPGVLFVDEWDIKRELELNYKVRQPTVIIRRKIPTPGSRDRLYAGFGKTYPDFCALPSEQLKRNSDWASSMTRLTLTKTDDADEEAIAVAASHSVPDFNPQDTILHACLEKMSDTKDTVVDLYDQIDVLKANNKMLVEQFDEMKEQLNRTTSRLITLEKKMQQKDVEIEGLKNKNSLLETALTDVNRKMASSSE
jgi:hypothetical protein